MAEMAPTLDMYVEAPIVPSLHLQPDNSGRPPKMSPEEAAFLLEKGPFIGRLNASRRILEIAVRIMGDADETDLFPRGYVDSLRQDVEDRATEVALATYGSARDETEAKVVVTPLDKAMHGMETESVETAASERESLLLVTDSQRATNFLKRKATALCAQVDPELFFPEKGGTSKPAKKICEHSCDLTEECLEYALGKGERFGIWGGKSERERRKINREANKA